MLLSVVCNCGIFNLLVSTPVEVLAATGDISAMMKPVCFVLT